MALALSESNDANYYINNYTDPTNFLTPVGTFAASPGHYGTYDMGGNLLQWNETAVNSFDRGIRGGCWSLDANSLTASGQSTGDPTSVQYSIGFRVATSIAVPEPSSIALAIVGGAFVFALARRRCAATRSR